MISFFANQIDKRDSCYTNVKYVVLLMLRNESEVKVRQEVLRFACYLLVVGLILWAKHAGLFVASFCQDLIFD